MIEVDADFQHVVQDFIKFKEQFRGVSGRVRLDLKSTCIFHWNFWAYVIMSMFLHVAMTCPEVS